MSKLNVKTGLFCSRLTHVLGLNGPGSWKRLEWKMEFRSIIGNGSTLYKKGIDVVTEGKRSFDSSELLQK